MVTILYILVSVALCFVAGANGEDCVAGSVQNLRMLPGGNLTWTVSDDEPCQIDEFQVDVEGDRQDEYHFKVKETYADLSFLEVCEEWQFYVTPISNGVAGYRLRIVDWIPLPPDADLSLSFFRTEIMEGDVLLEWDLANKTRGDCTLEYRIAITDQHSASTNDIYVTGLSTVLTTLSPCIPYRLAIRAINTAIGGIEGPLKSDQIEIPAYPEDPPTLMSLAVGPTSINTTWRLENFVTNRCPVTNLYVDGGRYFNITRPIRDPFGRPPVEVNVTGLLPNSMYYFRTFVENTGGASTAVALAVQTLNLDPGRE